MEQQHSLEKIEMLEVADFIAVNKFEKAKSRRCTKRCA
jgi:putative protein kinase ArgK-like GTPase of G3E family